MISDKDALICDMAETYGIYDLRSLPVNVIATLAAGLRDDSRIRLKLSGGKLQRADVVLAMIYDALRDIFAREKTEHRYADYLLGLEETGTKELKGYESPNKFEEARRRILGG